MLVTTRRYGEVISIGDDIKIIVVDIRGGSVRLGIEAPKDVPILRDDAVRSFQKRPVWRSR